MKYFKLKENTCELFHRAVSEKEHPWLRKESGDNLWVDIVIRAEDGVHSNSEYANKHGQHDHEACQLFDLIFTWKIH